MNLRKTRMKNWTRRNWKKINILLLEHVLVVGDKLSFILVTSFLTVAGGDCRPRRRGRGVVDGVDDGLAAGHGYFELNSSHDVAVVLTYSLFGTVSLKKKQEKW